MSQTDKSDSDLPQPSGERPTGKARRRADPCKGVATPSQPRMHRPRGKGNTLLEVVNVYESMFELFTVLRLLGFHVDSQYGVSLRARLVQHLAELEDDIARLRAALAALDGE